MVEITTQSQWMKMTSHSKDPGLTEASETILTLEDLVKIFERSHQRSLELMERTIEFMEWYRSPEGYQKVMKDFAKTLGIYAHKLSQEERRTALMDHFIAKAEEEIADGR